MDLVGFGIVLPLLALYSEHWGAGAPVIGLLFASYSLMQLLFAPVWGRWSDRIGRRPVILISLAGSTLSYVLFAVATAAHSLPLLFISRILAGVMGANIPVAQAYIADTTTDEQRTHGMGLIGAAFGLGFIVGPGFAGLLLQFGEIAPGIGAAVICGANLLLALVRLPESLTPERRRTAAPGESRPRAVLRALGAPTLRPLLWMFFVTTLTFSIWETTLAIFCLRRFGWQEQTMTWVYTYAGVLGVLVQGVLVRRLRRRVGELSLIILGSAVSAVGFALLAAVGVPALHLIALAVFSLGVGLTSPALLGLLSRRAGSAEQGQVLGVGQSLGSLARVLGPLIGFGLLGWTDSLVSGAVETHWDEATPFVLSAALVLGVTVAALALRRAPEPPGFD
jgi:MFS family permease